MAQQVLHLDRHVVGRLGELSRKAANDRFSVTNAVEEIGIAECDVARARGNLRSHVGQHDLGRNDAEAAVIHRHDWTVPASMLAAARGLGVPDGSPFAVQLQRCVARERRQPFARRYAELKTRDAVCDAGLKPRATSVAERSLDEILLELTSEDL